MAWPLIIVGMLMGLAMILMQVRSPMLVSVGMYLPLNTTFAIFLGGVIKGLVERFSDARKHNAAQKARLLQAEHWLCVERARHYTESHRTTEGRHPSVRAALALARSHLGDAPVVAGRALREAEPRDVDGRASPVVQLDELNPLGLHVRVVVDLVDDDGGVSRGNEPGARAGVPGRGVRQRRLRHPQRARGRAAHRPAPLQGGP